MAQKDENKIEIDPEYIRHNRALRKAEEKEKEENKVTSEKVSKIVSEIFDGELAARQKQLEEIEDKVTKAQKLLHLVRYVLITSYYNKKNLEVKTTEESISKGFDNQNRIHPALKKLLGTNSGLGVFTSGKRRIASKNCDISEPATSQDTKKLKLDRAESSGTQSVDSNQNCLRNRKRKQHRLVIGNISKWMPSSEDDNTTHKWMMYVRGGKDQPEISHIIEKVVFYLHPSYRPHDVIEVSESPFHLTRRGWGEFPLRVQIFFKCPLNKPISIVHNLKLDKTYTGRQTLGNETIVDVYLHDNSPLKPHTISRPPESPSNPLPISEPEETERNDYYVPPPVLQATNNILEKTALSDTKIEADLLIFNYDQPAESPDLNSFSDSGIARSDSTPTNSDFVTTLSDSAFGHSDTASVSYEHDYCQDNDIIEEIFVDNGIEVQDDGFLDYLHFEHSYSLPGDWESSSDKHFKADGMSGDCIFNLKDPVSNETMTSNGSNDKNNHENKPTTNGHSEPESHLETDTKLLVRNSKYKVMLPENKFKCVGEAMPYLLRRLPLWHESAQLEEFKMIYPFMATSRQEFDSWNIGKRLNSEWNRARELKKLLHETFPTLKKWSTKACLMYARSHGYHFSLRNLGNFFRKDSAELRLINTCFVANSQKDGIRAERQDKVDVNVNVDIMSEEEKITAQQYPRVDMSDPALKHHCTFVKESALDCGIVLKPEELVEGVVVNGAERMILEAVKCFAESLVRRANHHAVCAAKESSENNCDITKQEIEMALKDRPEFQTIRDFQLKKREIDFFS
ncbi:unnamed protein product [Phaedon cochleariae]|uniref:YEATS domain-containing protein n=1 Tax=Phaedon cochleariae TaxID=80249 RepID=A0A9P0DNR5_PHACE|nr:unnamed protein product [Phaedon cochleariae]